MPRIATRELPYPDKAQASRHFKAKSDLLIKSLGKQSHINGGQYVLTYLNPKGEWEHYASDLLQDHIAPGPNSILNYEKLEVAKPDLVREMERRRAEHGRSQEALLAEVTAHPEFASKGYSVFGEEDDNLTDDDEDEDPEEQETRERDATRPKKQRLCQAVAAAPLKKTECTELDGYVSTPKVLTPSSSRTPLPTISTTPLYTHTIPRDQLSSWYMARFDAMHQAACKVVVKAWIKVIEPKKQVKFPYKDGDASKPTWWPEGVTHREPDHIGKPDRMKILETILRHPSIRITQLEIATSEVMAHLAGTRMRILREIFIIAKEESLRRDSDYDQIYVQTAYEPVRLESIPPEVGDKRSLSYDDDEQAPSAPTRKTAKRSSVSKAKQLKLQQQQQQRLQQEQQEQHRQRQLQLQQQQQQQLLMLQQQQHHIHEQQPQQYQQQQQQQLLLQAQHNHHQQQQQVHSQHSQEMHQPQPQLKEPQSQHPPLFEGRITAPLGHSQNSFFYYEPSLALPNGNTQGQMFLGHPVAPTVHQSVPTNGLDPRVYPANQQQYSSTGYPAGYTSVPLYTDQTGSFMNSFGHDLPVVVPETSTSWNVPGGQF